MPKSIREPARRVPVIGTYDVVVLGGGPAGVASAVAAARGGAKTLLVEQTGALGGMATGGLVPVLAPFSRAGDPLIRGIGLEIVERLRALGAVGKDHSGYGWVPFDAECLKRVFDEIVAEAGASVLFFTFFAGVVRRGRRIEAALLENKAGRSAVAAKQFIDATGDADVAARAGVPCEKGDARGRMQAASLCFAMAGVDVKRYWKHIDSVGDVQAWLRKLESQGKLLRLPRAEYRGVHGQQVGPGMIGFNFAHVYEVDGTNPADLTRIMIDGRRLIHSFVSFARKSLPGMEKARLVASATLPGIRETRRIRGKVRLTVNDCLSCRHFPDDIAWYDYPVDVHNACRNSAQWKKFVSDFDTKTLKPGESYGIPFGALVPKGVDNLLVAGRSLSSDRGGQGCARCMPSCFAMGQAAGTASALAAKKRIPMVSGLDVGVLRRALRRDGALV